MSDYFATAFVRIKADPKGLRAQLRADVNRAIGKQTFKVPIEFEVRAFRAKIQSEIRRSKFTVPLTPDVAGFRRTLREKLKGLTITVPVKVVPGQVRQVPGGAGIEEAVDRPVRERAGGDAAGGAGRTRATAEEKALA